MLVLSNTETQTLQPGETATFNNVILKKGCTECHRKGTGSVKMRSRTTYRVSFHGNISGPTADSLVSLVMTLNGDPLNETQMVATPSVANAFNNVSAETIISNCCCDFDRVSIVNNGTTALTIGFNPSFIVKPICNC